MLATVRLSWASFAKLHEMGLTNCRVEAHKLTGRLVLAQLILGKIVLIVFEFDVHSPDDHDNSKSDGHSVLKLWEHASLTYRSLSDR